MCPLLEERRRERETLWRKVRAKEGGMLKERKEERKGGEEGELGRQGNIQEIKVTKELVEGYRRVRG